MYDPVLDGMVPRAPARHVQQMVPEPSNQQESQSARPIERRAFNTPTAGAAENLSKRKASNSPQPSQISLQSRQQPMAPATHDGKGKEPRR
jgi:hypothetical protein